MPDSPPARLTPPLVSRLSLLAEQILPVLARTAKPYRMTVAHTTWVALHTTMAEVFRALSDTQDRSPRVAASAAFDTFKWNLKLLESQRLIAPGTVAAMSRDVTEVGKMIGGLLRKTPSF